MAVIAGAVLALVLAAVLSGPVAPAVHVEPEVTFALPPTSLGCGGETVAANGVKRLPLTVSTVAGQTAETVNVCIGGRGPYPFVLDSGAGQSTIDAGLAKRLDLASDGAPNIIAGVGCIFAGLCFDPNGQSISEGAFQAQRDTWLPSDEDKAYVTSLMQAVTEPGKIASWVAPPARGINGQPFEFVYVK